MFSLPFNVNYQSVFEISNVPLEGIIPIDFPSFTEKVKNFAEQLINLENVVGYFHFLWLGGYVFFYAIMLGVPALFIFWLLVELNLSGENNDKGIESKPLIAFKRFERKVLVPISFEVKSFWGFVKDSKVWKTIWLIIVLFSLNIVTISIEAASLYFVLLCSFDLPGIYILVYKLFADLSILVRVPIPVWVVVVVVFILMWRKKEGYKRLASRELKNKHFICEVLCTFVIIFATMGAGKTALMTDIILSKQQQLRSDAQSIMQEVDFAFPDFPWANFESDLKKLIDNHTLYNLQSIDAYFSNLKVTGERYYDDVEYRKYYDKAVSKGKAKPVLWGYDVEYYGAWHDNALKYEYIFDSLRDYAQAYFIYTLSTSLVFSNYAIVTKDKKDDTGNFPLWMTDFFNVPTFDGESETLNSHEADNDMFRLGRKFDENNKYKDVFEFGVLGYTEGDKERGNMLDTMELKKLVDEVNQKNDNFNATFKMSRHPATIRNRKFFFAYMDMQRKESINADLREIGDTVEIKSVDSTKMLMPFFAIDELIFNLIVPGFVEKYYKFRHDRGDMNLTMYLMKKVVTWINNHYMRSYNTFGCKTEHLVVNDEKTVDYYIMPKKIFSGVYSSDALASFFRMKASRTKLGINDVPTFKSDKASVEELEQLNSYFVRDWMKYLGKDGTGGVDVKE